MKVSKFIEWLKTQDQEAIVKVVLSSDSDRYSWGGSDCRRDHFYVRDEIFDAHPSEYSEINEGSSGNEKTYLLLGSIE